MIDGVTARFEDGELVALLGPLGSGKTTLLEIIQTLRFADEGDYQYNSMLVAQMQRKQLFVLRNLEIGSVLQGLPMAEELSVIENVSLPLIFSKLRTSKAKRRMYAAAALDNCGAAHLMDKKVCDLTSPEKMLISLARATVNRPSTLLVDDLTPENVGTDGCVMDVIQAIHRSGTTVILSTKQEEIAQSCERIICLANGKITSDSSLASHLYD